MSTPRPPEASARRTLEFDPGRARSRACPRPRLASRWAALGRQALGSGDVGSADLALRRAAASARLSPRAIALGDGAPKSRGTLELKACDLLLMEGARPAGRGDDALTDAPLGALLDIDLAGFPFVGRGRLESAEALSAHRGRTRRWSALAALAAQMLSVEARTSNLDGRALLDARREATLRYAGRAERTTARSDSPEEPHASQERT